MSDVTQILSQIEAQNPAAAEAMRRILVDSARRKAAEKHRGGRQRQAFGDIEFAADAFLAKVIAVHEARDRLGSERPLWQAAQRALAPSGLPI